MAIHRQALGFLALAAAIGAVPAHALTPEQHAQVDRIFGQWGAQTPGCAVGVAEAGKPVLMRAYGMADLEHGIKNSTDTVFEAGSVSKQFTAAAVALLARDGKLSLDDQVRQYIPELPDYGVPLTIRHMLNHTSGLRDWGEVADIGGAPRGSRVYTNAHVLDIVGRQSALNFAPGTRWSYSNTGYSLAAIIVERVSGKPFSTFTRERLFEPLGMANTSWRDDYSRILKNRAIAYDQRADGYHTDMPFENVVGNGGLLTTIGDLLKWNQNIDHPRVGDAAFWAVAQTPGKLADGSAHNYGLGLGVSSFEGLRQVGHGGATAGYRSTLGRYPHTGWSIAVLCNAGNAQPGADANALVRLLLAGRPLMATLPAVADAPKFVAGGPSLRASARTIAEVPLAELAGTYLSVDADTSYVVAEENGALVARGRHGQLMKLTRVSGDRFFIGATAVVFRRDAREKVDGLSVSVDRVWDMRFERQPGRAGI
jgi:CubicO group peptidase (beta-lactamase class C family)